MTNHGKGTTFSRAGRQAPHLGFSPWGMLLAAREIFMKRALENLAGIALSLRLSQLLGGFAEGQVFVFAKHRMASPLHRARGIQEKKIRVVSAGEIGKFLQLSVALK